MKRNTENTSDYRIFRPQNGQLLCLPYTAGLPDVLAVAVALSRAEHTRVEVRRSQSNPRGGLGESVVLAEFPADTRDEG